MKNSMKKYDRITFPRFLFCLLLVFVLTGCNQQEDSSTTSSLPVQPAKTYEGTIIAMGDSLTAGLGVAAEEAYPALLEKELQRQGFNWQVINGGISGETSSGALSRINWIIARKPDIVILETGANDGFRGVPAMTVKENISRAVQLLQEAKITVILAGMQMLRNYGPAYTTQFAAVYPAVAAERQVLLIPFFLEQVAGEPALNLEDTIHPTPEGYRIVVQTIYPYVIKAIEQKRR